MPIDPATLIGKHVSFQHQGRRLAGVITEAVAIGRNPRGDIPDFRVTVRGASGRTLTVPSTVDAYLSITEHTP